MLILLLVWTCWQRRSAVYQIHSRSAGKAMDQKKARLAWVELDAKTRDAGLACGRCGIHRPALRKWWRCYQADGEAGRAEDSGVGAAGRDLKIVEQILIRFTCTGVLLTNHDILRVEH
jgi:hypothetical protein